MKLPSTIALALLAPLALLAALGATGRQLPVPIFGRDYVLRFPFEEIAGRQRLPGISGPSGDGYPLVVIDPGHGGFDYGATGTKYLEKDLVLGLALALRERLLEANDIRVAMTRENDGFVPLDDRLAMARELGADLFLSIHADSAGEQSDVAGASIYTLSSEASSRAAAQFAARENAADRINGVALSGHGQDVDAILIDLSRRQTQADSRRFAELVERSGEGLIGFHPQAQRSASLVVLRAPDIPSVLFEAGFVTNAGDAAQLASGEGRERFAQAMASAIRAYFVRRETRVVASDG